VPDGYTLVGYFFEEIVVRDARNGNDGRWDRDDRNDGDGRGDQDDRDDRRVIRLRIDVYQKN
jgi:hypothetical protein